ncbi:MAG: diacylglycerol kinase [Candidatus Accumulibacter sp.]|jgi:diacylglycerol kinase (ATP)|nr:diacylglycerol kinase [Accumulibacter sp.]
MPEKKPLNLSSVSSLWKAFGYSLSGLRVAMGERAFFQEILLVIVLIPASFFLTTDGVSRALMIASTLLVPIVELLNSAVEAAIDRISPEWHNLSKKAKDMGSAAVLLALINLAFVWACVLF